VVTIGTEAATDCSGTDTAAVAATHLRQVMRSAWSAYYAANKADPRNPQDVADVAHTARVAALALIAIAASLEADHGSAGNGQHEPGVGALPSSVPSRQRAKAPAAKATDQPSGGTGADGSTGGTTEGHTRKA
jgi:hypothetical protein